MIAARWVCNQRLLIGAVCVDICRHDWVETHRRHSLRTMNQGTPARMDSPDNTKELVERFSARVKDVFEFDKDRIHSVVQTILSPNAHENCALAVRG